MKKMIFTVAILTGLFAASNAQRNQKIDKPNQVRQGPTDKPGTRPRIERKPAIGVSTGSSASIKVTEGSNNQRNNPPVKNGTSKPSIGKPRMANPRTGGASIRVTEGSNNQRSNPPSKSGTTKPINRKGSIQVAPKKN